MTAVERAALLAKLELTRIRLVDAIAEWALAPKTDYELDGQKFSWGDKMASLTSQLKEINKQIDRLSRIRIDWLGVEPTSPRDLA